MKESKKKALIIGAGPAGLTAGYELLKTEKFTVSLVERESVVGGISKTTPFKGCKFDIGPHHFITESEHILQWWKNIMAGDFPALKRFTRIYYKKHFFHYPLEPFNVVRGLSMWECIKSIASYVHVRFRPIKNVNSFQDWVTNRFGHRLFSIFFKTYTEKVWGIPCDQLSADWSAQRIKGFSLSKAIFYAFFGRWFTKNKPRTLSDVFYYPSKGAGDLWERVEQYILRQEESSIYMNSDVVGIEHSGTKITAVLTKKSEKKASGGSQALTRHDADCFFSSMSLRSLVLALDPIAPLAVVKAAKSLQYRGLVMVNLIVNKQHVSPDHWLYIHDKDVRMGRVGNMNNFSQLMVDDPSQHTALGIEYFTFTNESFWSKSDYELVEIGKKEIEKIGLVKSAAVVDGFVMRVAEAYPVYNSGYRKHVDTVFNYLNQFENLFLMGRNGLHQYNNMDIAMLSAMDAVQKAVFYQSNISVPKEKKSSRDSTVLT